MKPRAAHIAPIAAAGRATNTAATSTSSSSSAASCTSMATALEGNTTRGSSCGGGGGVAGGVDGGVPRHPTATTTTSAGGASSSPGAVSNGTASSGGAPLGGDSPVGPAGVGGMWKHAAELDEGKQLQLQQLAREQGQEHKQGSPPDQPCDQSRSNASSAAAPSSYGKAPAAPHPCTTPAAMARAPATPPAKLPSLARGQKLGLGLLLPLLAAWWVAAFLAAWLLTLLVVPSYLVAQRFYWALPFVRSIWLRMGPLAGWPTRLGFEASLSINTYTRLLTLGMRPHLPAFYLLGFPKCGTTSLAEHLKRHPGLSATAGLPYHETLSKESHFFQGVFGRHHASSAALYRSFFPCLLERWWREVVRGAGGWGCFDACPLAACMPHTAARIQQLTPGARFVVMLRDPVKAVFSAEIMLRDMGVPLGWSLTEEVAPGDRRLEETPERVRDLWRRLEALPPSDPLPADLPAVLYGTDDDAPAAPTATAPTLLGSTLQCAMYAQLLQPYLARFPTDRFLFIHLDDFVADQEGVVRQVLEFVGADAQSYVHRPLPPAMQNQYGRRKVHPTARAALERLFAEPNRQLAALLQRNDLGWAGLEGA